MLWSFVGVGVGVRKEGRKAGKEGSGILFIVIPINSSVFL